ncbi:MAG: hypothetical protein RLZZ136_1292 [Pseudomonadota bacterium]
MGETAPADQRSTGSKILRLLGLGGDLGPVSSLPQPSRNPHLAARQILLDRMGEFLITHDLEISPQNLLCLHAAFSGADLNMARKLAERQSSGEAMTQEWLDSLAEGLAPVLVKNPDLDRLVAKLESAVSSFTQTTRTAHSVAADYNSELARHAETIDDSEVTGQMLSSLAELTKAMLERTRQVEHDMKRSEREAVSLRKSLEKAQREAEIDHLTGLPNRRAFEALLSTHYRAAQMAIEPLSVALCDIDHFKAVNDRHGHDAGDRVIQAIGQVLVRVTDEKCHVARHGGEEFVMLFRGMTKREAQVKLDEARTVMAARRFVNRMTDEPIDMITFSGGIADVFAYADPRAALRAADEALYRAKEGGATGSNWRKLCAPVQQVRGFALVIKQDRPQLRRPCGRVYLVRRARRASGPRWPRPSDLALSRR